MFHVGAGRASPVPAAVRVAPFWRPAFSSSGDRDLLGNAAPACRAPLLSIIIAVWIGNTGSPRHAATTCVRQFQRAAVTARGERRAFGRNGGFRPSTRGIQPHEAVSRTTSLLGSWTPLDGGRRPFHGHRIPAAACSFFRGPCSRVRQRVREPPDRAWIKPG